LQSETATRIKSSAFCRPTECHLAENACRKPFAPRKTATGRLPRQRLVLFRYNLAAKLMQKIHTLTDN
jgi:hypothetical protein